MPDYSQPVVLRNGKSTVEDFVRVLQEWRLDMAACPSRNDGLLTMPRAPLSVTPSTGAFWSSSRRPSCTASPSSTNRRG